MNKKKIQFACFIGSRIISSVASHSEHRKRDLDWERRTKKLRQSNTLQRLIRKPFQSKKKRNTHECHDKYVQFHAYIRCVSCTCRQLKQSVQTNPLNFNEYHIVSLLFSPTATAINLSKHTHTSRPVIPIWCALFLNIPLSCPPLISQQHKMPVREFMISFRYDYDRQHALKWNDDGKKNRRYKPFERPRSFRFTWRPMSVVSLSPRVSVAVIRVLHCTFIMKLWCFDLFHRWKGCAAHCLHARAPIARQYSGHRFTSVLLGEY